MEMGYIIILGNGNEKYGMNIKTKTRKKRLGRIKWLGTRRRTTLFKRQRIRGRRKSRTVKTISTAATTVPERLPITFILKDLSVERLTPDEVTKCNDLLQGCFTGVIDMSQLEIDNTCVLGMLGNELVTFMCIRQSPLETTDSNDSKLIHTVCTSEQYRGRGLLKQMFHWVASTPKYMNAFFRLEAANTSEPDKGLNQTIRFRIYSKTGFVLKVGTEFRPCNDMVKMVRIKPEIAEITYQLVNSAGGERWVKPEEMEMETCYIPNLQNSGCWMESNAFLMREFNK